MMTMPDTRPELFLDWKFVNDDAFYFDDIAGLMAIQKQPDGSFIIRCNGAAIAEQPANMTGKLAAMEVATVFIRNKRYPVT